MSGCNDQVYREFQEQVTPFIFDEKVTNVFDDMIRRSVPGYAPITALVGILAKQYAQSQTNVYDLGCSLGTGTKEIQKNITGRKCKIVAVDNSEAMIKSCLKNLTQEILDGEVECLREDLRKVAIVNASMVVMNFTLQFIDPPDRLKIIRDIYAGLTAGGILVISEKIKSDSSHEQEALVELYQLYKKLNGYSDLEISQKRTALENVLIPDTVATHQRRFEEAGFKYSVVWFQCFNFVSMVAFK